MVKGKKVLVTGAGGFIGSHLVEALLEKGANVRAFVKYNSRSDWGMLSDLPEEAQKSFEVIAGDIRDPFFVRKAVQGCDYVFHLAALIGIPYSYVAPSDYVSVNVQGTVNLLQACLDERIPRFVHTSTSETYGTALYVPIDEKHPLQGQSPYSASKIGADKMVESYYKSFDLPAVTVRPFNTFGPRQSSRAFIPTVISQALTRKKILLGSLEPVRDMTFVKDTVEGLITVGLSDKVLGQAVNLGMGDGQTVGSIAKTILHILDKQNMPIEEDLTRIRPEKSEVMRLISDNTKAREICGWSPTYSLEQGLAETIEWIKKNLNRYRPDRYTL
ncbi:MAG: SDR family NAD(P)-dependent oxidoreductase [Phycisphaerae bacterium]|nr:SDR family NAD(P)-dependent oxidoreductase [Phycisphaerae bacterium]NIP54683.1 SDR family NAD(P)-dependent oxidoreductase [Phycisphaerae bacterium]NIS53552.1 SDR family NAD(P)-dependent oxidoreductase [Phycisphaerae bacterium]NIU11012.1 SDR family NAD(P)-dependent oxidoreductase [Phycisphaerae bacterium]NIU58895.1 SDR family NAD(P)-dependent oxidoreductase [Phycisphaerae bacterium]